MFKVNQKDIRMTSFTSFWCRYYLLWIDFTHYFGVFVVDFGQLNFG